VSACRRAKTDAPNCSIPDAVSFWCNVFVCAMQSSEQNPWLATRALVLLAVPLEPNYDLLLSRCARRHMFSEQAVSTPG